MSQLPFVGAAVGAKVGSGVRAAGLALALAGALVTAACSDGGSDAPADAAPLPDGAMARETITESIYLPINETVESIMVGGAGDAARIHATVASPSLDWNLHGHAGGGTQIVNEGFKQMVVDYDFSPTAQSDWYLLLRNKGQTDVMVELKVELFGNMQWRGRQ